MIATIWEPFLTVGVKYANNDAIATRRAGGFCRKGGICRICMLAQRPARLLGKKGATKPLWQVGAWSVPPQIECDRCSHNSSSTT